MNLHDILYRVFSSPYTIICCVIISLIAGLVLRAKQKEVGSEEGCVPCSMFEKHGIDPEMNPLFAQVNITLTTKEGIRLCCFNRFNLDLLLSNLLETETGEEDEEEETEEAKPLPASSLPSVKKQLLPPLDDESIVRFHLTNDDKETEHSVEILVQEKAIIVLHPGSYLVYMSVHVHPNSDCPKDNVKFQVVLSSTETDKFSIILDGDNFKKEGIGRTFFVDGIYSLDARDRIQVVITNPCLVVFKKDSSFFGMTMVPG